MAEPPELLAMAAGASCILRRSHGWANVPTTVRISSSAQNSGSWPPQTTGNHSLGRINSGPTTTPV